MLQQKNGIWYFRKMIGGEQINKSTRTANRRDAERIASKWETDAHNGVLGFTKELTFGDWWATFLDTYVPRYKSGRDFARTVNKVLPEWRNQRLSKLTASVCEAFVAKRLRAGAAPGTVGLERRLLKIIFEKAKEDGKVRVNPLHARSTGLSSPTRLRVLSKDEQGHLLAHSSPKMQRIVQFAVLTGVRSAELRGMKASHLIQLPSIGLRVLGKGSKIRVIPLGARVQQLFPQVLTDLLNVRGQVLTSKALLENLQRAVARVNLAGDLVMDPLTLHDLRRTFGTRCAEQNMPMAALAELMGHSSIATTAKYYVHLTSASLHSALMAVQADGSEPVGDSKSASAK